MIRRRLCVLLVGITACSLGGLVRAQKPAAEADKQETVAPQDADLFAVELINADLADAKAAMARFDGNDDGRLDAREMGRLTWKDDPRVFDLNKNGALTQVELAVRFGFRRQQAGVKGIDLVIMQRMLNRFDKNKDRNLSAAEIRAGGWPAEPELFDLDKDGSLSPFEMAAGLSMKRRQREENGITGLDQRQAIEFIAQFDKNKDKRVDAEEFEAAESPFDSKKFDTDGDGLLSRDEVAIGYARRRKEYDVKLVDQKNAVGRLNRHDRNRDRHLDEEEILAAEWPEYPERYDLDKNKRLSRFELEVLMARQRNERGVSAEDIAAAVRLIKRYDKNGNGYIDSDEAEGELPPGVTPRTRVTTDTFVDFDADTDLRLGRKETAEFMASLRAE